MESPFKLLPISFTKALVALVSSLLFACSEPKEQIFIDQMIKVKGQVELSTGDRERNLEGEVLTAEGERLGKHRFAIQGDGSFEFYLKPEQVAQNLEESAAFQFLLMGRKVDYGQLMSGTFANRSVGWFRFEIRDQEFANGEAYGVYNQFLVPVARQHRFGTQQEILLNSEKELLKLNSVGGIFVGVTDSEGNPIPQAKSAVLPRTGEPTVEILSTQLFNSIIQQQSSGEPILQFPVPAENADPRFQVMVVAEGYCPFVSRELIYEKSNPPHIDVVLERCLNNDDPIPAFQAGFHHEIKTQANNKKTIGYVNQPEVTLSLQSLSSQLRGVKVTVYEGLLAEGLPYSEEIFHTFTNELTVNVPRTFDRGDSENGSFLIQLESLWNENDTSLFGSPGLIELIGFKSTQKPEIDAGILRVYSSTGAEGIISGKPDQKFAVAYDQCPEQGELGLYLPGQLSENKIQFVPCEQGIVEFTGNPALTNGLELGGETELTFFIKDRFGNISDDDIITNVNQKTVYIDFGVPDLAQQRLNFGIDFSIESIGAAPSDVFNTGVVITKDTVETFEVRFSTEGCKHDSPSLEDGMDAEMRGQRIFSYGISNKDIPLLGKDLELCPEVTKLNASHIKFSDVPGEPASFFMTVMDLAGNLSVPFRYDIPSCNGNPSAYVACID